MKNSQFYFEGNNEVEIWSEYVNGKIDYWEKVNGVSKTLTKKQYENRVKKVSKQNYEMGRSEYPLADECYDMRHSSY